MQEPVNKMQLLKNKHTSVDTSSIKYHKGTKIPHEENLIDKKRSEEHSQGTVSGSLEESGKTKSMEYRDSEKFAHFFDDKQTNEDIQSEQSIEEYEDNVFDSGGSHAKVKTVTVKRRSLKKKEVTYETGKTDRISNVETESEEKDKSENEEEDDEYVWVEEEVDEEIEDETSDDEIDEDTEEEGEYFEEIEKEITEEIEEFEDAEEMEVLDEGEEKEFFKEEIEEEIEEADVIEEEIEEEREVREEETEEDKEEQEITEAQLEEIEVVPMEEEEKEEYEVGEEEMMEEFEEGLGEEEEVIFKKKKRKLKTIKIVRMVRKLKKDVIKELKEKAKPVEAAEEKIEDQIDEQKETPSVKLTEEDRQERERIFEVMKLLLNELIFLKRKNKTLSKNIVEYYKKRGENVVEMDLPSSDLVRKYHKRLKVLEEFQKIVDAEIERMSIEMKEMKFELDSINEEYEQEKTELLQWEESVGKSVIKAQTGKPLEDSVINHLLQRHDLILNQLSKERLMLVTLQNQMLSKETALKQLVAFEGKLSLIDYEQLRMDNQIFSDKLEERDNELAHLRKKVLEIIHTHAHVLEKTSAITENIDDFSCQDQKTNAEMIEMRERVNKLKQTRDNLRGDTSKLRQNAGLLLRPKLAIDYEESLRKIDHARNKVEKLMKTYKHQKVTIENLRKEITDATTFHDLF